MIRPHADIPNANRHRPSCFLVVLEQPAQWQNLRRQALHVGPPPVAQLAPYPVPAGPDVRGDFAETAEVRGYGLVGGVVGYVLRGGDALRVDGQEGCVAPCVHGTHVRPVQSASVEFGHRQQRGSVEEGSLARCVADAELPALVIAPGEDAALFVQRGGMVVARSYGANLEAREPVHFVWGVEGLIFP